MNTSTLTTPTLSRDSAEISNNVDVGSVDVPKQKLLPFDGTKEQQRLERVEKLLGTIPKIDRASAPVFDYHEATRIATGRR